MKKYIITILLGVAGLQLFAKNIDELATEFKDINSNWQIATQWASENVKDLQNAWLEFKKTPYTNNFSNEFSLAISKLDKEQKENINLKRSMFSYYYAQVNEKMDASNQEKFSINCIRFLKNNGNELKKLKNENYASFEGYTLSYNFRLYLSFSFNDLNGLYANKDNFDKFSKEILESNVEKLRIMLLNTRDIKMAKEICNAYENAMILKDCNNLEKIQIVNKVLTSRLIDTKVSK
jgi:hypothetical protein